MNFQRSIFLGVKNEFSIQNQGISGESRVDQVIYKYLYQGSVRRCCLIMDHRSYMLGCPTTRIIKRPSNVLKSIETNRGSSSLNI